MCLSRNSNASPRNFFMTFPNPVSAETVMFFLEIIIELFAFVPGPKFKNLFSESFSSFSKCGSQKWFASSRNYSKKISNHVLAENGQHLLEILFLAAFSYWLQEEHARSRDVVTWPNRVKIPSAQPLIQIARSCSLAKLSVFKLSSTQPSPKVLNSLLFHFTKRAKIFNFKFNSLRYSF